MHTIVAAAQPITCRGVGYKLFTAGLIPSMARSDMQRVYRLLKEAREREMIPWEWIVDETRGIERIASWADAEEYTNCVIRGYRRDHWDQQPQRVEVWSEKATVRGVLQPVLDEYGVGFRVMHGFGSATEVYNIAQDDDGRELIVLYASDWDPSGLWMSERDPPERLSRYGILGINTPWTLDDWIGDGTRELIGRDPGAFVAGLEPGTVKHLAQQGPELAKWLFV
jgi:hypothetical protein